MQDGALLPSNILENNTIIWQETYGKTDSKNAVMFDFSKSDITGFGAYFGDLESSSLGVRAEVILLDSNMDILQKSKVANSIDESLCGYPGNNKFAGCGNRTTRFIAHSNSDAEYMIVVVGDDDSGDNGYREHLSFSSPLGVISKETSVAKESIEEVQLEEEEEPKLLDDVIDSGVLEKDVSEIGANDLPVGLLFETLLDEDKRKKLLQPISNFFYDLTAGDSSGVSDVSSRVAEVEVVETIEATEDIPIIEEEIEITTEDTTVEPLLVEEIEVVYDDTVELCAGECNEDMEVGIEGNQSQELISEKDDNIAIEEILGASFEENSAKTPEISYNNLPNSGGGIYATIISFLIFSFYRAYRKEFNRINRV